jgi:hypothetical protein
MREERRLRMFENRMLWLWKYETKHLSLGTTWEKPCFNSHKQSELNYYVNRMNTMPITEQAAKQEWEKILEMA